MHLGCTTINKNSMSTFSDRWKEPSPLLLSFVLHLAGIQSSSRISLVRGRNKHCVMKYTHARQCSCIPPFQLKQHKVDRQQRVTFLSFQQSKCLKGRLIREDDVPKYFHAMHIQGCILLHPVSSGSGSPELIRPVLLYISWELGFFRLHFWILKEEHTGYMLTLCVSASVCKSM